MLQPNINKTISLFIKKKRKEQKLTQSQLAELSFGSIKSKSRISEIESGKKDITLNTLSKILSSLNCDLKDLGEFN